MPNWRTHSFSFAVVLAFAFTSSILCRVDAADIEAGGTQNSAAMKYFTEGTKRSSDGDFVGAVISLTLALNADSKYGQAYANRAAARFNLRDYKGSVEDIDVAHKYLPNVTSVTALQTRAHEALARAGTNGAQGQDEAHQQAARQAAQQANQQVH